MLFGFGMKRVHEMEERRMKKIIRFVICTAPLLFLSACSGKAIEVSIVDGHTTTIVEVSGGETVDEILTEAELSVEEKDSVSPSFDTAISDDGFVITITRNCTVEVVCDDGEAVMLELNGGTVADAIEKAGITLGEHDLLNHDAGMYLTDGLVIEYTHRVEVNLTVDGEKSQCITSAKNVGELLSECDIELGKDDRINVAADAVLAENDSIIIERVNVKTVTEKETVAFATKTEYSSALYQGQSSVKQQGISGEKEVTYEVTYVDNVEESRRQVKEVVTKEPVDEIILLGTKQKVSNGKTVVSRERVYDCDGSGHGYWIITYSDGTVSYEDF